jgi:hypothetical protein
MNATEDDLLEMAVIETEAFVPVLISVEWLRETHAVIDFWANTMTTTSRGIVRSFELHRLPSGHLAKSLKQAAPGTSPRKDLGTPPRTVLRDSASGSQSRTARWSKERQGRGEGP